MLERSIEGFFRIGGEDAGRQLALPGMVAEALAAISLTGAGFIGAVATLPVFFLDAIHRMLLDSEWRPLNRWA
jgi:hypothetical protein